MELTDALTERFWKRVVQAPDACWTWTGHCNENGYGLLWVRRSRGKYGWLKAHRYSYLLHHQTLPNDLFVCHSCDNPPCVNPAHLFLGTQTDNMGDAARKGRMPSRLSPERLKNRLRGRANPRNKLSPEAAWEIRTSTGRGSMAAMVRKHSVSFGLVWQIRNGLAWRWLTEPPS